MEKLREMYQYAREMELCKNQKGFAEIVGVTPNNMSNAFSDKLADKFCSNSFLLKVNDALGHVFSTDWLLYGDGDMLKENNTAAHIIDTTQNENNDNDTQHYTTLPLVPLSAIAGYNGWDNEGVALDDCPQYSIPDFIAVKAEFLIRVSGSSMYPKYSSGDILACRKVQEIRFIQWGKVYVIDGSQGTMVKRLFEIPDDQENILCKSDNENYPPFKLPKDDIRSLSIVVGAIRLE
ncbi:MAG: helix-turn-helix transcriptional regulator [Paludibacteraceae bacterium]